MNNNKALLAILICALLATSASVMMQAGTGFILNGYTDAKLVNDTFLYAQFPTETNSATKLIIACNSENMLIATKVLPYHVQVHILLDDWDWKVSQIAWQKESPSTNSILENRLLRSIQ